MLCCYGVLLDHKQVCIIRVLWDVTPCSVIDRQKYFGKLYSSIHGIDHEDGGRNLSGRLVHICPATWRYFSGDTILKADFHENFTPHCTLCGNARQSEALPNTTVSTASPIHTVWVCAVFNYLSWQITEDCQ